MVTLNYTQSATDLISGINANLQEMGSAVQLTSSVSASQMVSALNAEFYGIDGVTELSTSMTAQTFVAALNTNFGLAGEGGVSVKEQYLEEVADTISKVNALDNGDGISFLLVTDIHYHPLEEVPIPALNTHFDDSVVCMKAVHSEINADSLYCLGDIIEGNPTLVNSVNDAQHLMQSMSSAGLPPLYIALGNHDNNRNGFGSSHAVISRADMKTMFMDYVENDVTFANTDYKSDYYKDYASQNLRVIFIYGNSGSNGGYQFGEETRTFLGNSLDSLPSGYKAIVVTHVPPMSKMNYNGTTRSYGETGNTTVNGVAISGGVKGIIQAYTDKVIAMFYGHCHQDNVWADPFVCIGTCCNKGSAINGSTSAWAEDAVMPDRNANDETADLWDVVLIKPTAKVIEMVRFGAGADRTIHYEPIECAAGSSVTLTSKISGGTWGLRTSDQSKASVANGVVTIGAVASGTLISVWCKSTDWSVNNNKQLTAGSAVEYWTIKVVLTNNA